MGLFTAIISLVVYLSMSVSLGTFVCDVAHAVTGAISRTSPFS